MSASFERIPYLSLFNEVSVFKVAMAGRFGTIVVETMQAALLIKDWPRSRTGSQHDSPPWRRRRDSNPRYRIYQYDGLANRWFQPLTHVSGSQRRSAPIARGFGGGKGLAGTFYGTMPDNARDSACRKTDSPCRAPIAAPAHIDSAEPE